MRHDKKVGLDISKWNEILYSKNGHLLQNIHWGNLKQLFNWKCIHMQTDNILIQLLIKKLPLNLSFIYIPKGPVVNYHDIPNLDKAIALIHDIANKNNAVLVKMEPHIWLDDDLYEPVDSLLKKHHFIHANTIQPKYTIYINLTRTEDDILASFKKKTRYNIKLAIKKGVVVKEGIFTDLPRFYALAKITAQRNNFGIHSLAYYESAYKLLKDQCKILLAEYDSELLASLILFHQGDTAYYLYGASSNKLRNFMPGYLIQWEAIKWAKRIGCKIYDMWGVPGFDKSKFSMDNGMWSVYKFKTGFNGEEKESIGAFNFIYKPIVYKILTRLNSRI